MLQWLLQGTTSSLSDRSERNDVENVQQVWEYEICVDERLALNNSESKMRSHKSSLKIDEEKVYRH
jgi:hypothetical protein